MLNSQKPKSSDYNSRTSPQICCVADFHEGLKHQNLKYKLFYLQIFTKKNPFKDQKCLTLEGVVFQFQCLLSVAQIEVAEEEVKKL